MKRILLFLLLVLALLLGLTSCGPREYKTYALEAFCDTAQAGEYVTVSGVLKIPETIMEYDRTYGLLLVEDLDQDQPYVRIGIPIGKGKNEMQSILVDFTLEDIQIQTDDGQSVTHGDAISVSGHFGGYCYVGNSDIDVKLIEAQK
jgi:hypothetical protein